MFNSLILIYLLNNSKYRQQNTYPFLIMVDDQKQQFHNIDLVLQEILTKMVFTLFKSCFLYESRFLLNLILMYIHFHF